MELLQLKYFCDAAQTENFSRTAARFLVPPSNISQMMRRLEEELGVELFEHQGNKIRLAEAGRRFYAHVSVAMAMLEDARSEAISTKEICGDIKMKVLLNRWWVTEAIEKFKAEHPSVNFVIRHEDDDNSYDIIITDKCPDGFFLERVLLEDEIVLALNRSHPLADEAVLGADDLRRERFISMPRGRSLHSVTDDICERLGFIPDVSIQTDDPQYIRKYVEIGLGIAFVPRYSWGGLFSDNVVLKSVGGYMRSTCVFLPSRRRIKSSVAVFLDCLSETVRERMAF